LFVKATARQRDRVFKWAVPAPELERSPNFIMERVGHDGDAVIEGSESSRPAAHYTANRALFVLLLSAPYRTKSAKQSSRRKPLGRTVT